MPTARELDHEYRMRVLQVISVGWSGLMRLLSVAVAFGSVYLAAREFAGKITYADMQFKAIADLKANKWLAVAVPWGLSGTAVAWGAGERYLRKRHIKRVSSESSEMQATIDEKRRSSRLTKRGESSPEDI
jgi:hypothetical protein